MPDAGSLKLTRRNRVQFGEELGQLGDEMFAQSGIARRWDLARQKRVSERAMRKFRSWR